MKRIAILLTAILLLASCQATPQEEYVIPKNNNDLMTSIDQTPQPKPTETQTMSPENLFEEKALSEKLDNGNLFVEIDATVKMPSIAAAPVYNVQPQSFSSSQIEQYCKLLFGDADLKNFNDRSKEQIEKELIETKQFLADVNSGKYDYQGSDLVEMYKNESAEKIARLEEEYQSAPDTSINPGPVSYELIPDEYGAGLHIYGTYPDGTTGEVYVYKPLDKNATTSDNLLSFYRNDKRKPEEFIKLLVKEESDRYVLVKSEVLSNGKERLLYAYSQRQIPVTVSESQELGGTTTSEELYSPVFSPEIFQFVMNAGVIESFLWRNPCSISERYNAVDLLPFDQIYETFKKQVFLRDYGAEKLRLIINDIKLGYYYLPQKDSNNKYLLVPVWDFIGIKEDDKGNFWGIGEEGSFLTINAIDGTIINRLLGY